MPSFSPQSEKQLSTCDERLQKIARIAIEVMDFVVMEGHRGKEAQDVAVARGASKVSWPHGKHNSIPSLAMDVAPFPIDWKDTERFVLLHGVIKAIAHDLGIKIRHGIDWDSDLNMREERFKDFPHIELVDE